MTRVDPADSIYLDNAATSFPKPAPVYEAVVSFLRSNGGAAGRGAHSKADSAARTIQQCRERTARLLNAESLDRIAFTFNCTDSLNLLLRGILKQGDHVITSRLEHNSVLRPLTDLQMQKDVTVDYLDFDPATGLLDVGALEELLKSRPTRLVVLSHASNVLGTVQPIQQLAQVAHQHAALFLLDAAQTVGHLPLDCRQLNVDFLAAAGHKGMLGPLGTGIVYVREGLESGLTNVRSGGTGTTSEQIRQPQTMPARLESGNMNGPGLAGLNAAVQWLLEQDLGKLHEKAAAQCHALGTALRELPGVRILAPESGRQNVGIVSFVIDELDAADVAAILDQSFGIQCRAGLHCAPLCHQHLQTDAIGGAVRLSPGPFTTDEQVDATVDALKQIAASVVT